MNESALVPLASANYGMSLETMAGHMYKSGFFKDCRGVSQAITKIVLGRSLGLDPATSMMGLFINAQGKMSMSANLMARCIKASGKYRWEFDEGCPNEKFCAGTVFEKVDGEWRKVGRETVKIEDFKHINNPTYKTYPKNMLVARWFSNVSKFFCPDAFGGSPVYLPDEIPNSGLTVDPESGEVISAVSPEEKSLPQELEVEFIPSKPNEGNGEKEVCSEDELIMLMKRADVTLVDVNKKLGTKIESVGSLDPKQRGVLKDLLRARLEVMRN